MDAAEASRWLARAAKGHNGDTAHELEFEGPPTSFTDDTNTWTTIHSGDCAACEWHGDGMSTRLLPAVVGPDGPQQVTPYWAPVATRDTAPNQLLLISKTNKHPD